MGKASKLRQERRKWLSRWEFRLTYWGTLLAWAGLAYAMMDSHPFLNSLLYLVALSQLLAGAWFYFSWAWFYKAALIVISIAAFGLIENRWLSEVTMQSFVFVKPGVWLNNTTWLMMIDQRGSRDVFNVELTMIDEDKRQSGSPGLDFQRTIQLPEVDRNKPFWAKDFTWTPNNADSEHYTVVSTSREGAIVEDLEIKRIDGKWLYAARIYDRENRKDFLYCRDANFPISDKWPTSLQPCFPEFRTNYSIL